MDLDHPTSILLQDAAEVGGELRFSQQPSRRQGTGLAGAEVTPLRKQDRALVEEARIAAGIVKSIRRGDLDAEEAMVERYSKGLNYLLTRRIGDAERARDLLQDTFFIAISKLREEKLENPARLAGYLRGIAIRVALNAGRRRAREPYPIDIEAVQQMPDPEPPQFEHVSREQTLFAVRQLLSKLPVERDREILMRLYVHNQDKQEICEALDLDSLHFNRVLFRAKRRFRKILEQSEQFADLGNGPGD